MAAQSLKYPMNNIFEIIKDYEKSIGNHQVFLPPLPKKVIVVYLSWVVSYFWCLYLVAKNSIGLSLVLSLLLFVTSGLYVIIQISKLLLKLPRELEWDRFLEYIDEDVSRNLKLKRQVTNHIDLNQHSSSQLIEEIEVLISLLNKRQKLSGLLFGKFLSVGLIPLLIAFFVGLFSLLGLSIEEGKLLVVGNGLNLFKVAVVLGSFGAIFIIILAYSNLDYINRLEAYTTNIERAVRNNGNYRKT